MKHKSDVAAWEEHHDPTKDPKVVAVEKRKYIPVDADSWGDALRILNGWLLVILFSLVSGGLFALAEVLLRLPFDRDVRDMHWDTRIGNTATADYHKHFLNGDICCSQDIFSERGSCLRRVDPNFYDVQGPYCPPMMVIQCPGNVTTINCNATRAALYQAMGLDETGGYASCSNPLTGKLRVGSRPLNLGRPYQIVAVGWDDRTVLDVMQVNPFSLNVDDMRAFVSKMAAAYTDPLFVLPERRLSRSVRVDGAPTQVVMPPPDGGKSGIKEIKPWPKEIFTWPGMTKRCPNTGVQAQFFLLGNTYIKFAPFNMSDPGAMVTRVHFQRDFIDVPQWKVAPLLSDTLKAQQDDYGKYGVYPLTNITLSVGLTSVAGPCYGWLIDEDPESIQLLYDSPPVFNGTMDEIRAANITGGPFRAVGIRVNDVSVPRKVSVPFYAGMWFIVFTFGMAAIWLFSTGFFILIPIPLIWWNTRINQGLAPVVYRYMKRYRGW